MKKILSLFLICGLLLSLFGCNREKEYTELGIPSAAQYDKGSRAICPWDLFIQDGILYIGAGDYDKNAGPIHIWGYDPNAEVWSDTGTLPDEEAAKFLTVNGALTVPGTDPQGDWSYGSYYQLKDGQWVVSENIPGGIHMFDMVEYDGAIFAGLGVLPGDNPIVCSKDGGKSFSSVPLKKDGKDIDTSLYETVRVYDFFLCNDTLYAMFVHGTESITLDLFRFADGCFHYEEECGSKINFLKISGKLINAKANFKDKLFFTSGWLYSTEDMETVTRIQPPNATVVYDLLVSNGRLYVLSAAKAEEGYRISVSSSKTGDSDDFKEEFYFYYSSPPLSFAKAKNCFYIGMGTLSEKNPQNGMILKVSLR